MIKAAAFAFVIIFSLMTSSVWADDLSVPSPEPIAQIAQLTVPRVNVEAPFRIQPAIAVPRRPDVLFSISRFALYTATAADLATTWRGMHIGRVEANPMLGQSRAVQGAIVGGSIVALSALTQHLSHRGHPRFASVLNFVVAGEHTFAAWHNSVN